MPHQSSGYTFEEGIANETISAGTKRNVIFGLEIDIFMKKLKQTQRQMQHTLQTVFGAHGFFKHAFLHLLTEHCSSYAQSELFKQLFCIAIDNKTKKLKIISDIIPKCLAIFRSIATLVTYSSLNRCQLNAY